MLLQNYQLPVNRCRYNSDKKEVDCGKGFCMIMIYATSPVEDIVQKRERLAANGSRSEDLSEKDLWWTEIYHLAFAASIKPHTANAKQLTPGTMNNIFQYGVVSNEEMMANVTSSATIAAAVNILRLTFSRESA